MATARKFKKGDIVKLKSGGPKMTVDDPMSAIGGGTVECQWFAGSKLQQGYFDPESLELFTEETK